MRPHRAASTALLALTLLTLLPGRALAHGVFVGQSDVRQDGAVVRYDLAVHDDELAKRVGLRPVAPHGAPPLAVPDTEREAALRDGADTVLAHVAEHVRVLADGMPCAADLAGSEVVHHRTEVFALLSLVYDCGTAAATSYEVRYELFFDRLARAERAGHASMASYDLGGESGRVVLEPGAERLRTGTPPVLAVAAGAAADPWRDPWRGAALLLVPALLVAIARRRRTVVLAVGGFVAGVLGATPVETAGQEAWLAPAAGIVAVVALGPMAVALRRGRAVWVAVGGAVVGMAAGVVLADALSPGLADAAAWRRLAAAVGASAGVAVAVVAVTALGWPLARRVRRLRPGRADAPAATTGA